MGKIDLGFVQDQPILAPYPIIIEANTVGILTCRLPRFLHNDFTLQLVEKRD